MLAAIDTAAQPYTIYMVGNGLPQNG